MKKSNKVIALVLLAIVCLVGLTNCTKGSPDPAAYETYTSSVNDFTVVLPRGCTVEEDTKAEDGGLGMARFITEGGEVGIVLAARRGDEDPLPSTEEAYQAANPNQEILNFVNLSKTGEFDGYKANVRIEETGEIGIFYVFRFTDTEVTVAAKADNRQIADLLEVGLDQIRLPGADGGIL